MIKTHIILSVIAAGLALLSGCAGTSTVHNSGNDASVDVGVFDGGVGDVGSVDAAPDHDAGPAANGTLCADTDACASGNCVDGVCCEAECDGLCLSCRGAETGGLDGACQPVIVLTDPASECPLDEASCAPGTCDGSGACSLGADGSVCRPDEGSCDVAEICSAGVCPPDVLREDGVECRTADGPCDVAEHCDGAEAACPANAFLDGSTRCRDSAGACDLEELCDGVSAACPADTLALSGSTCRAASGDCDAAELCSGATPACPADTLALSGTVCRPAAGSCDVAESCTGTGSACPSDVTDAMACASAPNASASCVAGGCAYACINANWGDCDALPGCETPFNTNTNCGRCGQSCGPFTCRGLSGGWACRP